MDCSTIDVDSARAVGEAASKAGIKFVDAPVSGGVAAAEGGTLTFMVGGPEEAFEAAKPFLGKKNMGQGRHPRGRCRRGPGGQDLQQHAARHPYDRHMRSLCTGGKKLGLDPQRFFDIASKASGQSWSMTSYCPVPGPVPAAPSNRGYKPGFAAPMMLKDLRLAMETAKSADAAIPLGAHAERLYTLFIESGGSEKDFSGIIEMIAANRTE